MNIKLSNVSTSLQITLFSQALKANLMLMVSSVMRMTASTLAFIIFSATSTTALASIGFMAAIEAGIVGPSLGICHYIIKILGKKVNKDQVLKEGLFLVTTMSVLPMIAMPAIGYGLNWIMGNTAISNLVMRFCFYYIPVIPMTMLATTMQDFAIGIERRDIETLSNFMAMVFNPLTTYLFLNKLGMGVVGFAASFFMRYLAIFTTITAHLWHKKAEYELFTDEYPFSKFTSFVPAFLHSKLSKTDSDTDSETSSETFSKRFPIAHEIWCKGMHISYALAAELAYRIAAAYVFISQLNDTAKSAYSILVTLGLFIRVVFGIAPQNTATLQVSQATDEEKQSKYKPQDIFSFINIGCLIVLLFSIPALLVALIKPQAITEFFLKADNADEVRSTVNEPLLILLALGSYILESLASTMHAGPRGMGKTKTPAAMIGGAYWFFVAPLTALMMMVFNLGLKGFMLSRTAGMTLLLAASIGYWRNTGNTYLKGLKTDALPQTVADVNTEATTSNPETSTHDTAKDEIHFGFDETDLEVNFQHTNSLRR